MSEIMIFALLEIRNLETLLLLSGTCIAVDSSSFYLGANFAACKSCTDQQIYELSRSLQTSIRPI